MASIYSTHKPASGEGGGLYLKIQDGEAVKIRIASEPAIYETVPREGDENQRITTRYAWVVWNQDTKQAQVLQQSGTFFKNIAGFAQDDEWGDPTGYDIKVKREGTGLDTTYTITPSANKQPLDSEAKEAVKNVNLIELLEKSPFSQRVMWLAEAERGATASSVPKSEPKAEPVKQDKVVTGFDDSEPVNLDDIPFN